MSRQDNCKHDWLKSGYCSKCGAYEQFENEKNVYAVPEDHDPVQKPSHYRCGNIETIDVIKGSMTDDQFIGYLKGNIIKYVCRAQYKNGKEDLAKAVKYLEWLVEVI